VDLRTDIDLEKHSLITGNPISNAWIQEICVMQNKLKSLNLANGREVTDIGLWAIARHCSGLESLNLSKCNSITKIGLRSLSLRCQKLRSINFDGKLLSMLDFILLVSPCKSIYTLSA
jgi:hypothetical protein